MYVGYWFCYSPWVQACLFANVEEMKKHIEQDPSVLDSRETHHRSSGLHHLVLGARIPVAHRPFPEYGDRMEALGLLINKVREWRTHLQEGDVVFLLNFSFKGSSP